MQPRLSWTFSLLAINKYVATALSASGFAFSILTKDDFFAYLGFIFALIAIGVALVQAGLLHLKPVARILAISHALMSLFSLLFPLAIMALVELFSQKTNEAFERANASAASAQPSPIAGDTPSTETSAPAIAPVALSAASSPSALAFRMHRNTAVVFASVFVLLLTWSFTMRMIRS